MLNDYLAALIARWHTRGNLARSALPDAPVQPDGKHCKGDQDRPTQVPPRRTGRVEAGAPPGAPQPARADGSSWLRCPCGEDCPGRTASDSWLALCQHLLPQLDHELDAWDHAHGWLYR
jgi:hypothetical protein